MERGGQVDRDDRVPALFREIDDLGDMLDAGIVDQDVDPAEPVRRLRDQIPDLGRLGHVGRDIGRPHAVLLGEPGAQPLDLGRIAEPVQHDVAALGGERAGDAEPDPAGRTGDHGGLAFQHQISPAA